MKTGIWNTKQFHLLTNEHIVQMTVFEGTVEFDLFYRDPKKCSIPLRISLHNWRKFEAICDRRNKKEKKNCSTG